MVGLMDELMVGWLGRWIDHWMDGSLDNQVNGWIDFLDGWMHG